MLRVVHAERPAARLERFDGSQSSAPSAPALAIELQRSQTELAQVVREARLGAAATGPAATDAVQRLQSAVRRVELELPAPALERAALQLFECPPIHGGLFSSYGEMLMGESGGASLAIFVLRVPQLFDPTVFAGFSQLLEAFERLFLVVNLDAASRDLSSEGEVVTGLERSDPLRVVEVFERLTTCEPLERGLSEGRVRIVPVDLLEAARTRFAQEADGGSRASGARTRFDDFLDELAEALDRHEAFVTLVQSALRRAHECLEETRGLLALPALAELPFRLEQAENERGARARAGHALRRLRARARSEWQNEDAFVQLRERLAAELGARAQSLAQELAGPVALTIDDWFASAESVQGLIRGRLLPRVSDALDELARTAERALRAELASPACVESFSPDLARDFREAELVPAELLRAPAEGAAASPEGALLLPLDVEAIPVKPRLVDRLLLRSRARLRRALIGPPEAPASPLSTAQKEQRLGSEARARLRANAEGRVATLLSEAGRRISARSCEATLTAFVGELGARCEHLLSELEAPLAGLEARVDELRSMRARCQDLERACSLGTFSLEEIALRFGRAGGGVLLPPRPRRDGLPAPGARRALPAVGEEEDGQREREPELEDEPAYE
jgi:hypothetical protein